MTENEAIEYMENEVRCIKQASHCDRDCLKCGLVKEEQPLLESFAVAIQALEEIQQYRAIGTVEEIQKKMEELDRWHADRINENIKNPFAYTSTSICHNCDHKDEYIEELEEEVEEYKAIGTIEEFKALKEKNEPKKVIHLTYDKHYSYQCPSCGMKHNFRYKYCSCGQVIEY